MAVVLASQSPSRRAVLTQAGWRPLVIPADVNEDAILSAHAQESPAERLQHLAAAKAHDVARRSEAAGHLVIACDSMLLLHGELQGKPHTVAEAIRRWRQQSGQRAELLTGHCVVAPDGTEMRETAGSVVCFGRPTEEDIEAYARSGEPLECAGAFTLEARGGWFIDRIEGDPSTVLGISLPLLRGILYRLSYRVSDFW